MPGAGGCCTGPVTAKGDALMIGEDQQARRWSRRTSVPRQGPPVIPAAVNTDLQQAIAFISSSRLAAYREMQCRASRYAPDLGSGATRGESGIGHCSLPLVLDPVHVGQYHRAISVQFVEGIGDFRERPLRIRNALSREESEAAGGLRVDFRGAYARLLLIPYEDRQGTSAGLVQPLNPRGEVGFQRPPEHGKRLVGRHF